MDFRNTKIRIKSPEHSEAFQKAVFEAGGKWCRSGKNAQHTNAPYLYVDDDLYLTWSGEDAWRKYFSEHPNKEIQWHPEKSKGDFVELGLDIQAEMDRLKFAKTILEQACIIIAESGDDNSRYYATRALEAVK